MKKNYPSSFGRAAMSGVDFPLLKAWLAVALVTLPYITSLAIVADDRDALTIQTFDNELSNAAAPELSNASFKGNVLAKQSLP